MDKEQKYQELTISLLGRMRQYPGMAQHLPQMLDEVVKACGKEAAEGVTIAPAEKLLLYCWKENPDTFNGELYHPLAEDKKYTPSGEPDASQWEQKIIEALITVVQKSHPESWEKMFFLIWRFWQEECGSHCCLFPADVRLPGSSFFLHQDLESAMLSISKENDTPAFLLFQLGPVQDFIACAANTSDLLSGSYLIAYLTASAMKVVTDEVCPGCVIFPSLRGQGLFDLQNADILQSLPVWETLRKGEGMRNPTLPNRFLALVPAGRAKNLAEMAEAAIKNKLKIIGDCCFDAFCKDFETAAVYRERWDQQLERFPQITWQTLPFDEKNLEGENDSLKNFKNLAETEFKKPLTPEIANWSRYFQKVSKCLAARRNTRDFLQFDTASEAKGNSKSLKKDFLTGKEEIIGDEREWEEKDLRPLGAMSIIKQYWFDHYLCKTYGIQNPMEKNAHNTKKLSEGNKVSSPYIAVIAMDGDNMGKWIGGEKTPKFLNQLAPESRKFFSSLADKYPWLNEARIPVTPEYHLIFSSALATFANHEARNVVESCSGCLIYAGGDDVLALLPASRAVECAEKLKERFTALCSSNGMWLPGPEASISCGIAVGHYKTPLHNLITEAHRAEHCAKHKYERNAVALSIFKRSGEILQWGSRFNSCALPLLHAFEKAMQEKLISNRFANALAALLAPYQLEKAPKATGWKDEEARKILWAEFQHICCRQSTTPKGTPESLGLTDAESYLKQLSFDKLADFGNLFLAEKFLLRGEADEKEEE